MKKNIYIKTFILIAFIGIVTAKAQTFQLESNGIDLPVLEQNDVPLANGLETYKYARLTYLGKPLEVVVKTKGFDFNDAEWSISPKSYNIKGQKSGNQLSFTINRTGYLVLRFKNDQDFKKRLVVLIESPEVTPNDIVDVVKTYGIDNSGGMNETKKLQSALEEHSGSGKVLYFPDGIYKTFTLNIKSNTRIHLSKNTRIIADVSDLKPYLSDDETPLSRFILIKNAVNVSVTGLGAFDGNGTRMMIFNAEGSKTKIKKPRLLLIQNSKNISFNGVLLKDSGRWNTHILESEDVVFKNCKLLNNLAPSKYLGSLDGWDPDSSKRVLIEDCFGWAGDDTVAIKCTGIGPGVNVPDIEDITVRGCVFLTKKSGLKIGTETRCENMSRIIFENNDIIEADRVMGINVRDGAVVQQVLFKSNRSETYFPDRRQMGINFYITKRDRKLSKLGKILNVTIEDCTFEKAFPNKFSFYRNYEQSNKEDLQVTFKNVKIAQKVLQNQDIDFFDELKNNALLKFD